MRSFYAVIWLYFKGNGKAVREVKVEASTRPLAERVVRELGANAQILNPEIVKCIPYSMEEILPPSRFGERLLTADQFLEGVSLQTLPA